MSHFDKYREELSKLGLTSYEHLVELVKPLLTDATQFIANKPSQWTPEACFTSHFGGLPYFEKGEQWPKMQSGEPLDFIFQIVNTGNINLPDDIKILQFYYNFEEGPWDTDEDGWLVKTYKEIDENKNCIIENPVESEVKFCEITFIKIKSLPDWDSLELFSKKASNLSCILNENEPWGNYELVVNELTGGQDYCSQIGGYPNWVQGEEIPSLPNNQLKKLLFQLDSEDNPRLMWGDVGLVYIFYHPEKISSLDFILQCF